MIKGISSHREAVRRLQEDGPPWPGSSRESKRPGVLISVPAGAQIYGERDAADSLYKIDHGVVRTYKILLDGRRQIAAFYMPGDMFGLEPGSERLFSAEAVTDTKLLVMKYSVASVAASDSEIADELWRLSRREIERAQKHILLLIQSAPERVASFLLEMAERIQSNEESEMILPMGRQDIADYLGLTIETVSRVFRRLENLSVISLPTAKHVVVRDPDTLKRLNG